MMKKRDPPKETTSSFVKEAVKFSPRLHGVLSGLHSSLKDFSFTTGSVANLTYLQGVGKFGAVPVEVKLNDLKSDTIAQVKHPDGHFFLMHNKTNGLVYDMVKNNPNRQVVTSFERHMIDLLSRSGFESLVAVNARAENDELGEHYLTESEVADTSKGQVAARRGIFEMANERDVLDVHDVFSNITHNLTITNLVEHRDAFKVIGHFNARPEHTCVFEFRKNHFGKGHLRISRDLQDRLADNFKRHSGIYVSGNFETGELEFTHLDGKEFEKDKVYKLVKERLHAQGVKEL